MTPMMREILKQFKHNESAVLRARPCLTPGSIYPMSAEMQSLEPEWS